jgi:hypothetical protein
MFSNSVQGGTLPDTRGAGMYPPACGPGKLYVDIVKDILGAMCEAGIIGTRDHRPNIYNEIKQIIETGLQNGKNGAYYKPWDKGNIIPVTPFDFDKLKAKYYTPYGRMCTEKEMFPKNAGESDVDNLAKLGPIRKVIPPSFLYLPNTWKPGSDIPQGSPFFMYKEHPVNPDEIFKERDGQIWTCPDGELQNVPFQSAYKIQNLQFSKHYNDNTDGQYHSDAPSYVNRQLFFRAIPGSWGFLKWGTICLNVEDCEHCINQSACSPYQIYGYGPDD